jgi:hypothetical protein
MQRSLYNVRLWEAAILAANAPGACEKFDELLATNE